MNLAITEFYLALRGMWFRGRRYQCPCCGHRVRSFVAGGGSWRARECGYCPRCNAKARHRRIWLYLERHTDLGREPVDLLHVAPHYSLGRRISRTPLVGYTGIDLEPGPFVTSTADLTNLPGPGSGFDAAVCIHVLEHIEDDKAAIAELFRVLRPGGWAVISFPMRIGSPTYEDPTIVGAGARAAAFGETTHVRIYGDDVVERLASAGFEVTIDLASEIDPGQAARYGLLADENVLMCRKPESEPW